MSVAVSPYLPSSQTLGFSSGQQSDLLDALLASCQKSAMNPPLPGYGRALQPYFASDITPSTNPRLGTSPPAAGKQVTKGKGKNKKPRNKTSSSSGSDEEANISKSPSKFAGKLQMTNESNKAQTIKAVYNNPKTTSHGGLVWAGPTFGMAPSACEIPIPSDFLLH